MKKRGCCLAALLCAVLLCIGCAGQKEEGFAGRRELTASVSQSDVENYISGGRYSIEMLVRSRRPEWLECEVDSDGRDLQIRLAYSFQDFEEYIEKTEELIGCEPAVLYGGGGLDSYREGFSAAQLLNWMAAELQNRKLTLDIDPARLIQAESGNLSVNERKMEGTGCVSAQEPELKGLVRRAEIETLEKPFQTERTFRLQIPQERLDQETEQKFRRTLAAVGAGDYEKTESGELYEISFSLSGASLQEVSGKTALLLGTENTVEWKQSKEEDGQILHQITERMDASLLLEEEGSLVFTHIFPEETGTLELAETSDGSLDGLEYRFQDGKELSARYSFRGDFYWDHIAVDTEIRPLFFKNRRTITFFLQKSAAEPLHEQIKEAWAEILPSGCTLDIYDEGIYRRYEISFSSYLDGDIAKRTDALLGTRSKSSLPRMGFLVNQNQVKDRLKSPKLPVGAGVLGNYQTEYELPDGTVSESPAAYRYLDWYLTGGIVLAAGGAAVWFLLRRKKKRKGRCPSCGAKIISDKVFFCPSCGHRLKKKRREKKGGK